MRKLQKNCWQKLDLRRARTNTQSEERKPMNILKQWKQVRLEHQQPQTQHLNKNLWVIFTSKAEELAAQTNTKATKETEKIRGDGIFSAGELKHAWSTKPADWPEQIVIKLCCRNHQKLKRKTPSISRTIMMQWDMPILRQRNARGQSYCFGDIRSVWKTKLNKHIRRRL